MVVVGCSAAIAAAQVTAVGAQGARGHVVTHKMYTGEVGKPGKVFTLAWAPRDASKVGKKGPKASCSHILVLQVKCFMGHFTCHFKVTKII